VNKLLKEYRIEGLPMPYTIEDFRREIAREVMQEMTPEERLAGLPAEEIVKRLSPQERLAGLPVEERLARLSADEIDAYLKRAEKKATATNKPKSGRRR
jgi:hypothetical protein